MPGVLSIGVPARQNKKKDPCLRSLYTVALLAPFCAHGAINVDGVMDESEWEQAASCGPWRRTVPFAQDDPRVASEIAVVATPEGLAAVFTLEQPVSEARIKPRTPRDSESLVGDSVGLMIDFDASGHVGYEFSVGLGGGIRDGLITNQNQFDRDWDGVWKHAVRESGDGWQVELLIPWETVSMRPTDASSRRIGIYATRYLFNRNERYACPGIDEETPAFLSDFTTLEVAQFASPAALDIVPYATAIHDNIADANDFQIGADISWKPSANLWMTATLNPDFGQVESDELVIDFSAIETVFTDKRPFFTENQGIFELKTPANGQLIYTRRVGGAPDDGSAGSSEIDAALKVTGNLDAVGYGAFMAQEEEYESGLGRRFAASRVTAPLGHGRIGYLGTWADSPYLDRRALVNALDFDFTPGTFWRFAGQLIRSDIDSPDLDDRGYDMWLQTDLGRSSAVSHSAKLLYIDDTFDMNDLGYLERNSLRQAEWETRRRVAAGSDSARVSGETQALALVYRENQAGQRLQSELEVWRDVSYSSAWRAYQELSVSPAGIDDLISRGNGPVKLDTRYSLYADVISPRLGDWQYVLGAYVFQQGVQDYSGRLQIGATWYPTEALTLRLDVLPQYSDDWLLWQQGNLFGTYRARRLDFDFRLDWIPAPRHELRVKWQWIGIDADARQAWRSDADGNLEPALIMPLTVVPGGPAVVPFTVSNVGLQIRYRFELAPQSELFLVYGRGGYVLRDDDERTVTDLFGDMGEVRDADQFLLKFRYRLGRT